MNDNYNLYELNDVGQVSAQAVSKEEMLNRMIRLVPETFYSIMMPMIRAIAFWYTQENLPLSWWWLSFADKTGTIGCFAIEALHPYEALFKMCALGIDPPNGHIEIGAMCVGPVDRIEPADLSQTHRLLQPDEAENVQWTVLTTQSSPDQPSND